MSKLTRLVSCRGIGWIPYFASVDDVKNSAYQEFAGQSYQQRLFLVGLLKTGNDDPPDSAFSSVSSLKSFLKKKDYRAALSLSGIEIVHGESGDVQVAFTRDLTRRREVGYTPLTLRVLKATLTLFHEKGAAMTSEPRVEYPGDDVDRTIYLSHEVQFRVGMPGWLGGRFLVGYWLPYVWMRAEYLINQDDSYTLRLSGSFIPSQRWFVESAAPRMQLVQNESKPLQIPAGVTRLYDHDCASSSIGRDQIESVLKTTRRRAEGNYRTSFRRV
jgi:hypothetical protein